MKKTNLTKLEAVKAISARTGQPCTDVKPVVETFMQVMFEALSEQRRVELRGFGTLEPCLMQARVGRNPRRPDDGDFTIPARLKIKFRSGKLLQAAMSKSVKRVVATPV